MCLGVEDPAVLAIRVRDLPLGTLVRMDHVSVLKDFGEEERFLEV